MLKILSLLHCYLSTSIIVVLVSSNVSTAPFLLYGCYYNPNKWLRASYIDLVSQILSQFPGRSLLIRDFNIVLKPSKESGGCGMTIFRALLLVSGTN